MQDEAQEGPDSNALLSNQLSVVENSLSRNETEANENRRLPEVETAEFLGGLGDTFLKPRTTDNIVDDLTLLYAKLVDLGMEYRNGKVYLADLEERDV